MEEPEDSARLSEQARDFLFGVLTVFRYARHPLLSTTSASETSPAIADAAPNASIANRIQVSRNDGSMKLRILDRQMQKGLARSIFSTT
jgi:hypothetical protein